MTLQNYIETLKNKKVAVLGIGISNTPLIKLLATNNIDITACDKRSAEKLGDTYSDLKNLGVKLNLGETYLDNLHFDIIFRTPAILPNIPELIKAKENGAILTTEMEVFFELCPCKTIAITGSDGKTTTSSIIAELLKQDGKTVHLGGNIGKPLLTEVDEFNSEDVAVVELSSFQLHSINICPDIAVVTNVSPNHLDIHPSFEDYCKAKDNIFINQTKDCKLVLNLDNAYTAKLAKRATAEVKYFSRRETVATGVFCSHDMIYQSHEYTVEAILPASEILIPGVHNVENYMAAFCAVDGLISAESCRTVARGYKGVRHRLELIRVLDGVSYINDSIASSPTRTIAGLRAMKKKPILIAGGHDKHIPFEKLADEICERVKLLVLTGDTAETIRDKVKASMYYEPAALQILMADDLKMAIDTAKENSVNGDIVLLSPACSSFDRFKNFAERGDLFRKIVLEFEENNEIE